MKKPRRAGREIEEVDVVFRALAHASRRHVLLVLHFRGGEMSSRDIADRFACSWPTTTRHLRILRDAGLVRVYRRGRERYYGLAGKKLQRIVGDWLSWFRAEPLTGRRPS